MEDRIPVEVLERARRKLARHVASLLVHLMSEEDVDCAELDTRLGKKPGTTQDWLLGMINGARKDLDTISDMAVAMNREITFSVRRYVYESPEDPAQSQPTADKGE